MGNYKEQLNDLVNKLTNRLNEREKAYEDYLLEGGLTANAHTVGELQHVGMEINNFKRATEIAVDHSSTVNNFTIDFNHIMNKLNAITFKSLNLKI
ncbi:MAG: hypothetical protein K0S53_415 [Bacteroidetes bacterium]|jgi:hypothetical protein|nr:hypothetical protein [Bacteroidota bacterium]